MRQKWTKFYQKSRTERLHLLAENGLLTEAEKEILENNELLSEETADGLIENQIGQFPLPLGVAPNFVINGKDLVVPMVTEEPSVIAACSHGAKLMQTQGGFTTTMTERLVIGQIIFQNLIDSQATKEMLLKRKQEIISYTREIYPSIVKRGGGVADIDVKIIKDEVDHTDFLTVHLFVDVCDAMGANIVNTILEGTSQLLSTWVEGESLMSILSNYNDRSLVTATCKVHPLDLTTRELSGQAVAKKIVNATRYAQLDPYRAVTHNKGIMNGVDAVLIATGNDPRAIAAGIHAYASRNGQYESLSSWKLDDDGYLVGELTLPLPVGIVGGAISVLPLAQANLNILQCTSASQLAEIIVSVGLAQNFSAIKALVTEGIQRGHMSLHAKSLAIHAGALGEEIPLVAEELSQDKNMTLQLAKQLLIKIRQ